MTQWTRRSILQGIGGAIGSLAIPGALAIPGSLAIPTAAKAADSGSFGVVVYGATPGGIMAAYAAAREGASVALVAAGPIGGMSAQGLSWSDTAKLGVIGGLCLEFFHRVGKIYNPTSTAIVKNFEPHVAEAAFLSFIKEAGIKLVHFYSVAGVATSGRKIQSIQLTDGTVLKAAAFIDASYEGDLMAAARCAYWVGRDSSTRFNEANAGFDAVPAKHHLTTRDSRGTLFPTLKPYPTQARFTADKAIQSYTFRLSLTNDKSNMVRFAKPAGYDADRYGFELVLLSNPDRIFTPHNIGHNNKFDLNGNYYAASWEWPEGNAQRRKQIFQDHFNYQAGLLYFYANDPRVPSDYREQVNLFGLAKDEFVSTGNWPRQIYIREARRLAAKSVLTWKDTQTELTKLHPIGMGSYSLDSHPTQLLEISNGYMDYEGGFGLLATRATNPYQIPYECLLPREYDNFFVPVCAGASHVAFASLRMEPQFMIMGEAAGCAAGLIAKTGTTSTALATEITAKLRSYRATMEYTAAAKVADAADADPSASSAASQSSDPELPPGLSPLF
jgi:hypothetical protein